MANVLHRLKSIEKLAEDKLNMVHNGLTYFSSTNGSDLIVTRLTTHGKFLDEKEFPNGTELSKLLAYTGTNWQGMMIMDLAIIDDLTGLAEQFANEYVRNIKR